MKKIGMVFVVLIAATSLPLIASSSVDSQWWAAFDAGLDIPKKVEFGLECMTTITEGMPLLFRIHILNISEYNLRFGRKDLASAPFGNIGIELLFADQSGEVYHIGGLGWGREFGMATPLETVLAPGEELTMWTDMGLFQFRPPRRASVPTPGPPNRSIREDLDDFLSTGQWRIVAIMANRGGVSNEVKVTVRPPTLATQEAVDAMQADGVCKSIFPATLLREGLVPVQDLSGNDLRVVNMINVFRAAVRDPYAGLLEIEARRSESNGFLDELMAIIEYECLLEMERPEAAKSVLEARCDEVTAKMALEATEKHDGMLQRVRKGAKP